MKTPSHWLLPAAHLFALMMCMAQLQATEKLEDKFLKPPDEVRPWVYWFWLNGNISKEGITADLEAMKRVGIRGVLIMEVDQGTPVGPADFMGEKWRDLFKHVHHEARRLNLEVNMNNDAGWNGSGGPWIKPEDSMQKIVWKETELTGPKHFNATLPEPDSNEGFYRDISLLAFPKTGEYRLPNIRSKAAFEMGSTSPTPPTNLPPDAVLDRKQIIVLNRKMDENGRLIWDVPEGEWTLVRFGHTTTGIENAPAPMTGRGLECDKLSKQGITANFSGMMAKLVEDNRIKPIGEKFGLVATHIDSWENGSQNWTPRMRQDFWERRAYDLEPFLPVVTGRVVDSLEISERFLWDFRETVSELIIDNYAAKMRELAHKHGLRFTIEAYGSPCDFLPYAGQADEPMGEFWTPSGAIETCKGMASAGHIYGKRIIGAEAFTADDHERWLEHPASLKALGDRAFCEGINRFVFHRYAMQPWVPERRPGMMMGPWGQHYERTQTWWEETRAWHEYLARCQLLLRQGLFVADICYLQPEAPPQGFGSHPRAGYDWDECPADVLMTRMKVADHQLILPDGMSYRVLVLPDTTKMTPSLLRKIKDLTHAGATIIGQPPESSPSLNHYPRCDSEIKDIADELWADCDGVNMKNRHFGKGMVVRGMQPEEYLREAGLARDFAADSQLRFIHRVSESSHIYFVANSAKTRLQTSASFRVNGMVPEFWWPETGHIERAPVFTETNGATTVALQLPPAGSVFVVFRNGPANHDSIASLSRDGHLLFSAQSPNLVPIKIQSAVYGVLGDPQRSRDVRSSVQSLVDNGQTSFPAHNLAQGGDPAAGVLKTLVVTYSVDANQYTLKAPDPVTIHFGRHPITAQVIKARYGVLTDPARTRNVADKAQQLIDAGETTFKVARMAEGDDPAYLVVKTLELDYSIDGRDFHVKGTDPDEIDLGAVSAESAPLIASVIAPSNSPPLVEAWSAGTYTASTSLGHPLRCDVGELPPTLEITGPWQVRFDSGKGMQETVSFPQLISWSEHNEPKFKYFSGAATYTAHLRVPKDMLAKNRRVYIDLGDVQVMAQVHLNGHDLGLLWKPPFQLDATTAAKSGENKLEIKVINLWPNRLIGDEQLPEDSDRNADGTLKSWPQWLQEGKPSPTGRATFSSWRIWKKEDALIRSGLLGPVRLRCTELRELK